MYKINVRRIKLYCLGKHVHVRIKLYSEVLYSQHQLEKSIWALSTLLQTKCSNWFVELIFIKPLLGAITIWKKFCLVVFLGNASRMNRSNLEILLVLKIPVSMSVPFRHHVLTTVGHYTSLESTYFWLHVFYLESEQGKYGKHFLTVVLRFTVAGWAAYLLIGEQFSVNHLLWLSDFVALAYHKPELTATTEVVLENSTIILLAQYFTNWLFLILTFQKSSHFQCQWKRIMIMILLDSKDMYHQL